MKEDLHIEVYGLKVPTRATHPAVRFMAEYHRLLEFRAFLYALVVFTSRHSDSFFREFLEDAKTSKPVADFLRAYGDKAISALTVQHYEQLLAELYVCRVVDNFLMYLKELLALILQTRPEVLKTSEQIPIDFVLTFPSMEAFISGLAERRVDQLAFSGTRELLRHFEKIGLMLFSDPAMKTAIRIIESRNLLVHNRGIVNEVFQKRVPEYPAKLGERLKFDFEQGKLDEQFLANSVAEIDVRAASKFGLTIVEAGKH